MRDVESKVGCFYFDTMIQAWPPTEQYVSPFSVHAGLDLTAALRAEFRPRPTATFELHLLHFRRGC